jgi:hypothetical protein
MMRSAHLRWKKMGAMALAVVASSATTIVLAQSPASAAAPTVLDSHYTVSQLASGLSSPANGLRFRAATNDLLVSEFGADRITKIGASSGTKASFASLVAPNELAIASGGNVYAKSHPSGPIFRFSSSGAALNPSSFASPCTGQFGETSGLAFDATNNFYVGCAGDGTIYKFAAGTVTNPTLFASGLPDVEGLRFDGSGRLFTTDFPGGRVFQVTAGGTQLSDHTLWASGLNCPLNVAFDPVSHNVFATSTDRIVRMSAPGAVSTFATGFTSTSCAGAYALDFDPAGNLYVDDLSAGAVWKFTRKTAHPPNIFEVVIKRCVNLHVGYNYFPAGTVVHWNMSQAGVSVSSGNQFTTLGGGKDYHFLTMPIGATLQPDPDAEVRFSWTINGVLTRYKVTRDNGC